ncbi:MAG TPA: outer membrane protein assembly factor BamE [Gammaproteobacteria bacterium]|nr:outer membrane protein assembly factor BamE [Gammaproteobacteria bacterium]
MPFRLLSLVLLTLSLTACFKPEIRQGNFLDKDSVALLKPGMNQAQVLAIMGRPMIRDPFHAQRWDYVRWVNPNDGKPIQNWRVSVFFQNGLVASVDTPPPENPETQIQLPSVDDLTPLPQTKTSDQQGNGPPL